MKRFFLSALLVGATPFNTASQTPANQVQQGAKEGQFTLKTSTEIVLVNVVVKDKDDMLVKNLKAEDFTILEDGKKQDILSIDVENTDSVVTAETPKTELLSNLTSTTPSKPNSAAAALLTENDLKDRR